MSSKWILCLCAVPAILLSSVMTTLFGPAAALAASGTGSIAGYVYTDNGTPINGADVVASDWSTGVYAADTLSNASGAYSITGLAAGSYRVGARATRYLPQDYNGGTLTPVAVTNGNATTGMNFTLTRGRSISGHAYQDDGVTPIPSAHIIVYDNSTGVWVQVGDTLAGADGSYSVTTGVGGGTYYVRARAAGWAQKYYNNVTDKNLAAPVVVTAGNDTPGIDFTLSKTGYISGMVYTADGRTPLATAVLNAYDNATGQWVNDGISGAGNGLYFLNLAPGTYRIIASAPGYIAQWWYRVLVVSGTEMSYWGAATPITVAGNETPNYNFSMLPVKAVTTNDASNIGTTSATLNGDLTAMGTAGSVAVSFEWGTTTSYGNTTTARAKTVIGAFSEHLTGLTAETTYHYRVKAVGGGSAVYGGDMTFTTAKLPDTTAPTITLVASSGITKSGATITWTTNEGATSQVQYGLTAEYGSSTTEVTTLATSHSVDLTGLKAGKTYHYQVVSKDAAGNQAVSADYTFKTKSGSGGMPVWAWVLVGLAAVAVVGSASYFILSRKK